MVELNLMDVFCDQLSKKWFFIFRNRQGKEYNITIGDNNGDKNRILLLIEKN